jgi:hypothetical protein
MNTESGGPAPFCVRMLSEGSFDTQCCKCLKFSLPVKGIGPEHASSELFKQGWTCYNTSAARGSGQASCLECLRALAPNPRPCPS